MFLEILAAFGLATLIYIPLEKQQKEAQEKKRGLRRKSIDELRPMALAVPDRSELKSCYTKNIAGQGSLARGNGLELETVKLRKGIPTR